MNKKLPIEFENPETNEMVEAAWHDSLEFLDYTEEEIEILKDDDEMVDQFFKILLKWAGQRMVEEGLLTQEELEKTTLTDYLDGWYKGYVEATAMRLLEERGSKIA